MYEEFYGLSEKPFSLTPNPRFVFQSEQYRVAEEALVYGIGQKEGFMLVTGAPGTGKTTLCRDLLEKLDPEKYRVALLFNPFLSGIEMLQALLSEFGLGDATTTSRKELLDRLNAFLLEQLAAGRTCIAIFDEAQHLSTEFLEQIRVLSNLETEQEKLIQIILVGQPELLALIRTPQMAQLDQRVSVRCTLTDLSRDETARYITHRLNIAGSRGRVRFLDAAVRVMHGATGGVPRLINLTADRALLAGFGEQSRTIGETHVRQALASLRGDEGIDAAAAPAARLLASPGRSPMWWAAGAAVATIAVVGALWWQLDGAAELLAWRAARAPSSLEADRTYATIAREHRGSRHRPNALLRLAQSRIARGANDEALEWLTILQRDYPEVAGTEGQFWTARALLARGDTVGACSTARRVPPASARSLAAEFSSMDRECEAFDARRSADSVASAADSTRAIRVTGSARPPAAP